MKTPPVESVEVAAYRVPTDEPESDGTLKWDHTDVVVVHLTADGSTGLGWTYAAPAAAELDPKYSSPIMSLGNRRWRSKAFGRP